MPVLRVGYQGPAGSVGASGVWQGCRGHQGALGLIWKMKTAYCKVLLKTQDRSELRSTRPKLVPLLATRCLTLGSIEGMREGGVHLTKHQPDPQADNMSCWPTVVPLLTTRCLSWGLGQWGLAGGVGVSGGIGGIHMKKEDSLLQGTLKNSMYIWGQVNWT